MTYFGLTINFCINEEKKNQEWGFKRSFLGLFLFFDVGVEIWLEFGLGFELGFIEPKINPFAGVYYLFWRKLYNFCPNSGIVSNDKIDLFLCFLDCINWGV